MPRETKIINMSLPFSIYREVERMASKRDVSKSSILKEALEQYLNSEKVWQQIYTWGKESARQLNIKNEQDVERLIQDFRK